MECCSKVAQYVYITAGRCYAAADATSPAALFTLLAAACATPKAHPQAWSCLPFSSMQPGQKTSSCGQQVPSDSTTCAPAAAAAGVTALRSQQIWAERSGILLVCTHRAAECPTLPYVADCIVHSPGFVALAVSGLCLPGCSCQAVFACHTLTPVSSEHTTAKCSK
jgi:hypothetical protein